MERLLNDQITKQIQEVFSQLKDPVELLFFGQKNDCQYCDDTRQLLEEVVALSDKLSLSQFDLQEDAEIAKKHGVDKAPMVIFTGKQVDGELGYGIRYAGIPSGHEFNTLIQDLLLVSSRDSGLKQQTRDYLKKVNKPVYMQVFVTPT